MKKILILSIFLLGAGHLLAQGYKAFKDEESKKFGFKDEKGKVVIKPKYDKARDFSEEWAFVILGDKKLYIDAKGKTVLDVSHFDEAGSFNEGLAWASNPLDNEIMIGYIDKTGKLVVPIQFYDGGDFKDGLARVSQENENEDELYALMDKKGKLLTPFKYSYIDDFEDGYAIVKIEHADGEETEGAINVFGVEIIPPVYYDVSIPYEDIFVVQTLQTKKYGFINTKGIHITNAIYDKAWNFVEGVASVEIGEASFSIDKEGKCVEDCENKPADHP